MRGLFWKIFVTFWVFMLLLGMSSAFLTAKLMQTARHKRPIPVAKVIMHQQRMVARNVSEKQLNNWLKKINSHFPGSIYIVDSEGKDLLKRPLSEQLQASIQLPDTQASTQNNSAKKTWFFSRLFRNSPPEMIVKHFSLRSGQVYTLLIDQRANTEYWHFLRSLSLGARIALGTLLCGVICFFLARYLTIPLRKLSLATHQLAKGDYQNPIETQLLQRADEIGELSRDFEHMALQVNNMITAQQRLLRDVSHELRSPLARLQIALGLARQRSGQLVEPELDRIEQEAERLNDLIGHALALAKLTAQNTALQKTDFDLLQLLELVISDANYEAREKQCTVSLTAMQTQPIHANWELLYSAFANILRNAVQYTKARSCVQISASKHSSADSGYIEFIIRDHGPGLAEADLEQVFKPFFRADETRHQHSAGYGVGLAIAEQAVHLHGGEIRVNNAQGGGLLVRLTLPVANDVK